MSSGVSVSPGQQWPGFFVRKTTMQIDAKSPYQITFTDLVAAPIRVLAHFGRTTPEYKAQLLRAGLEVVWEHDDIALMARPAEEKPKQNS